MAIRKIISAALTGKKIHINIFNLNSLYDVTDKVIEYWFKFLTTCVNIKLNKDSYHPLLIDESHKFPTLMENDEKSESDQSDEEITNPPSQPTTFLNELKRKSLFGMVLKRRSIRKSVKITTNETSQDIMMYTFKSKGNLQKDYKNKLHDKKIFKLPEYKKIIMEFEKNPPDLNCINCFILFFFNEKF